jgi:hypothetical protein
MQNHLLPYKPVKGQTYTLFDDANGTNNYYNLIGRLADECLKRYPEAGDLLSEIRCISGKNRLQHKLLHHNDGTALSFVVRHLYEHLHPYTSEVHNHLKLLRLRKPFDQTIRTKELQYHLYMLEVELVNRMNIQAFRDTDFKIALLPHCLRDLSKKCKAELSDIDYVCSHCSRDCYVNYASELLSGFNILPYIWMTIDFKKLFKKLKAEDKTVGVLGIACIPELANGIRMVTKAGAPVVGIALNANRCIRWMGDFYDNSIDTEALKRLLG